MGKDIFTDFDDFDIPDPDGGTELVYGVNVIQVEACVRTSETAETVGAMVEKYREQLGIPTDAVVFIDGEKMEAYDAIPT